MLSRVHFLNMTEFSVSEIWYSEPRINKTRKTSEGLRSKLNGFLMKQPNSHIQSVPLTAIELV